MRLRERLGPHAYALLHAHEMGLELLLSPWSRRRARADLALLHGRLEVLSRYDTLAGGARARLHAPYVEYTREVSPAAITISLELATFLAVVCEARRPQAILDLGSGFSSYVFRDYASRASAAPRVCSVDLSSAWLARTQGFLAARRLGADGLCTLDALLAAGPETFDLVLLDIADLDTRVRLLDAVLARCRTGGLIVIDDMHVPAYRRAVERHLHARGLACFSLRSLTRRKLRYASVVLR